MSDRVDEFRTLHAEGIFIMPNPWDVGSARFLESLGFRALATTSSGFAATLGRPDQTVTRDELLAHTEMLAGAVNLPLNVDAERCYATDVAGVTETVRLIAAAGAAGCSIEDYDPASGRIDPVDVATERVAAAAQGAGSNRLVLTARAENHLYGFEDLEDTIARLCSYRDAGADVLYAPGLVDINDIERVTAETGAAVNVLARPHGPPVPELGAVGVRRVSTGGVLTMAAFGALQRAARELLDHGTSSYAIDAISSSDLEAHFDRGPRQSPDS